jgi:uncharacterized OB-fold protein
MPIRPDLEYYAHLASGRFMLPADNSGKPFFPPRTTVPGTGSENVHWIEASGRGTVYSTTTIYRKPPESNYNVALVELAEGPRIMTRVEDIGPADVKIGMPVVVRITTPEQGAPFVVFAPVQSR